MSLEYKAFMDAVTSEILETLLDDWTYLASVAAIVAEVEKSHNVDLPTREESISGLDPVLEARIATTLHVLRSMLSRHLLVPGELRPRFVAWTGDHSEWIARIDAGWREFGYDLSISDVCWFEITDEGRRFLEARAIAKNDDAFN